MFTSLERKRKRKKGAGVDDEHNRVSLKIRKSKLFII